MAGRLWQRRPIVIVVLAALVGACADPTGSGTSIQNILLHRAVWSRQSIHDYSYTYEFAAFNRFAYHPLQVEVRQDTVRSVVVLATGESIDPKYFPTIGALFERALSAAKNGSLKRADFDASRGYPTVLSYAALPDALSSEQASALQPPP